MFFLLIKDILKFSLLVGDGRSWKDEAVSVLQKLLKGMAQCISSGGH